MTANRSTRIKPLLLAGGKSAKAKLPKHLIQMPDGRPLYQHQLDLLLRACPDANTVYVSLGGESVLDPFLRDVAKPFFSGAFAVADEAWAPPIAIVYDPPFTTGELAGPAAGLLAAHHADPEAAWLVVSCDYPTLTADDLSFLRRSHVAEGADSARSKVTCLSDSAGHCEPLVGVWGSQALRELVQAAKHGTFDGLAATVKRQQGSGVVLRQQGEEMDMPPPPLQRLMDLHTETDWQEAHRAIHGFVAGEQQRRPATAAVTTAALVC